MCVRPCEVTWIIRLAETHSKFWSKKVFMIPTLQMNKLQLGEARALPKFPELGRENLT